MDTRFWGYVVMFVLLSVLGVLFNKIALKIKTVVLIVGLIISLFISVCVMMQVYNDKVDEPQLAAYLNSQLFDVVKSRNIIIEKKFHFWNREPQIVIYSGDKKVLSSSPFRSIYADTYKIFIKNQTLHIQGRFSHDDDMPSVAREIMFDVNKVVDLYDNKLKAESSWKQMNVK